MVLRKFNGKLSSETSRIATTEKGEKIMETQLSSFSFKKKETKIILNRKYVEAHNMNGIVTIPNGFTDIDQKAFKGKKNITKILLPRSIRRVGSGAFCGCESLQEVYLPNGIEAIGEEAFMECKALKSVDIPMSLRCLAQGVFKKCFSLEYVYGGQQITEINDEAFSNCRRLKEVAFGNYICSIGRYAFYRCESLERMVIKGPIIAIKSHAFDGSSISFVLLSNTLERIEEAAFFNCEALPQIIIPEKIKYIGNYAFARCPKLTKILFKGTIPSCGEAAFPSNARVVCSRTPDSQREMEALGFVLRKTQDERELYHFNLAPESVRKVECFEKEELLYISNMNRVANRLYCSRNRIKWAILSNGVESIGKKAFAYCHNLEEVTLPESLSRIEEGAFEECPLETVTIPEKVEKIERYTFQGTKKLKEVHFLGKIALDNQAFSQSSVRFLYFHKGMNLKPYLMRSVTLLCPPNEIDMVNYFKELGYEVTDDGNWTALRMKSFRKIKNRSSSSWCKDKKLVLSTREIPDFAYYGQKSLRSVTFQEGVERIGEGAFMGCANLKSVIFPKSLQTIDHSAFADCIALEEIKIPEHIKILWARSFLGCTSLEHVELPDGLKVIDQGVFQKCSKLKRINWPTQLVRINEGAFYLCKQLDFVKLPLSIEIIEGRAFMDCTNLKEIIIEHDIGFLSPKCINMKTVIMCHHDSQTEQMAKEKHIKIRYLKYTKSN